MPATRPVGELRERAAKLIIERVNSLGVAQAALDLQVSRQAIYGFKGGAFCPSLAIIQRACAVWGLQFDFNGLKVSERVFEGKTSAKKSSGTQSPTQLDFYDFWDKLRDQKTTVVRTRRINGAVEMTLRISIPA